MRKLYQEIALVLNAHENCIKMDENHPHLDLWEERLAELNDSLPHGSGISVCKIREDSTSGRIIIDFSYHFMNDGGYYTNWIDYVLYITPDFIHGFSMRITGRDKNDIKDYFYQVFADCLDGENY